MTYDEAISNNLEKCFNKKGAFDNEQDYLDPDTYSYFEDEKISPQWNLEILYYAI